MSPGPYFLYVDDGGFLWYFDHEHGTLYDLGPVFRLFLDSNCSGTAYTQALGVREVIRVAGLPGRWVRSDTEQAQTQHFGSADTGDQCVTNIGDSYSAVPVSTLRPAPDDPPLLPFTPPFHIEKR